jgi:alpha-tubulin suppressor-like RCC1 family protein
MKERSRRASTEVIGKLQVNAEKRNKEKVIVMKQMLMVVAMLTVMVAGLAAPAVAQIRGDFDSLYVDAARAWGDNSCAQLGDGTTTQRNMSVAVKNMNGVSDIAAGECLSLALKTDGTVWTLGYTPKQVSGLSGISAIAAGGAHNLALKSDGTVWAWGDNTFGQLGNGSTAEHTNTPVQVKNSSGVKAIAAGRAHSLALKTDGTVRSWGDNTLGQLGDGTPSTRYTPVTVSGLSGVSAITAGYKHSLALKTDGTVRSWGDNSKGQLGDGSTATRNTSVQVSNLGMVKALAGGEFHSLAIVKEEKEFTQ